MMNGMLWFDNTSLALAAKIKQALAYYGRKYGKSAEVCLISNVDAEGVSLEEISKDCSLQVKASKTVQPNTLWIGFEELVSKDLN